MIAANARRTSARFRSAYGPGFVGSARMALVTGFLRLDMRRKYGSRTLGAPPTATLLARLGELLDMVEATLDGWDAVRSRARVARMMEALSEPTQKASDAAQHSATPSPSNGGRGAQRDGDPPPAA